MGWITDTVDGKPVAMFEPANACFSVLYLHDHDERLPDSNEELTAALNEHQLACLAPWGGPGWWTERICPAFDPHLSAEQFVRQVVGERKPLAVVGTGMGGQGALRLAFRDPGRFPVVVAWNAAVDFHDWYGRGTPLDTLYDRREQARQDTATLQVRPHLTPMEIWFGCSSESEWYRGNDRLHEKLMAVGVSHTFQIAEEPPPWAVRLAIVGEALARASRRLF